MADSRQPEDSHPHWDTSGAQDPSPPAHGANGYPPSYRACQPGTAHGAAPPSYTSRENCFNGDHAVTAEQVSARIVQEVTAEAVAVLKGEQETRLQSVEDTANLPPSPPPSPAAEHCFRPLEQGKEEEEVLMLEEDEEMEGAAAEIVAALEELWSGDEPEPDGPPTKPLEQAAAVGEAQAGPPVQAVAFSAALDGPNGREEEVEEEEEVTVPEGKEESLDEGVSVCPLSGLPGCMLLYCL
uniref:Microtubule-associated protein 2 n=1 Tax=Oncorhynchus tshawytscha TaxID=74940 RepID=A0A8C8G0S2_ONCTS